MAINLYLLFAKQDSSIVDSGYYKCVAKNGLDHIETGAHVLIHETSGKQRA